MPESGSPLSKPLNIWLPLLLSLIMVIGMVIGARLSRSMDNNHHARTEMVVHKGQPSTLEEIMRYIDARYVDEVNGEDISKELIDQLLGRLDPHSNYLSPESLQRINEDLDGNFNGIGIEFMVLEDTINVITPILGGPSDQAGVMAGDKIIKVADTLVAGASYPQESIVKLIRGERGTEVMLHVQRDGLADLLPIKVTRDVIPIHSVDVAYEIEPQVLYVKLNRFSATTYREFMEGIEKYIDEEKKYHLILDLRNNPGGYLNEAVDILSQLFPQEDKLLVYTEGNNTRRIDYKSTGRNFFSIESIAVLVDEGSASASEIIAGAIQDWDRGYIIGRRTFGKGLVQEQYPLRNGGALRLTIARYFTPAGRCIQRDYSAGEDAYYKEANERQIAAITSDVDSLAWSDSTEFTTQSGRIVYAGGGIDPDYYMQIDSLELDPGFLSYAAHISEFGYRYYRSNITEFDLLDSISFYQNYNLPEKALTNFINFAEQKGVGKVATPDQAIANLIKQKLTARLALLKFGDEGWYRISNPLDPMVAKALQLVKDKVPIALED